MGLIEKSGFIPNAHIADVAIRAGMRGLKDSTGRPLFTQNPQQANSYMIDGISIYNMMNGAWDKTKAQLITGDFQQAVFSVRQDLTAKILDQGVITDPSDPSKILYNLAQQDMIAMRFVMRLGWEIPNPINALEPDGSKRCPFAILKPED